VTLWKIVYSSYKTNSWNLLPVLLQMLQEDVQNLKPQVTDLREQADLLVASAPEGCDSTHVESESDRVAKRYNTLNADIDALITEVETGSALLGDYQRDMRDLSGKLNAIEEEANSKPGIARDMGNLNKQFTGAEKLLEDLESKKEAIGDQGNKLHDLQNEGMVADPTNFVNQVSCTAYIDSSS
jgi:DNA repair exonuclease SbcCD ATPase subunit